MIGPVLFLIYFNELAARVSSTTRLLAPDTIPLYRFITASAEDHDTLQADLQKMEEWPEEEWGMRFHPSGKCSVLTMSRK